MSEQKPGFMTIHGPVTLKMLARLLPSLAEQLTDEEVDEEVKNRPYSYTYGRPMLRTFVRAHGDDLVLYRQEIHG